MFAVLNTLLAQVRATIEAIYPNPHDDGRVDSVVRQFLDPQEESTIEDLNGRIAPPLELDSTANVVETALKAIVSENEAITEPIIEETPVVQVEITSQREGHLQELKNLSNVLSSASLEITNREISDTNEGGDVKTSSVEESDPSIKKEPGFNSWKTYDEKTYQPPKQRSRGCLSFMCWFLSRPLVGLDHLLKWLLS